MEQQIQRAIAHELCDDAEKLWLIADTKDLDDVVESGFVENLCLLQQGVPLSETQQATWISLHPQTSHEKCQNTDDIVEVLVQS